jgi:hypothetical protein
MTISRTVRSDLRLINLKRPQTANNTNGMPNASPSAWAPNRATSFRVIVSASPLMSRKPAMTAIGATTTDRSRHPTSRPDSWRELASRAFALDGSRNLAVLDALPVSPTVEASLLAHVARPDRT